MAEEVLDESQETESDEQENKYCHCYPPNTRSWPVRLRFLYRP